MNQEFPQFWSALDDTRDQLVELERTYLTTSYARNKVVHTVNYLNNRAYCAMQTLEAALGGIDDGEACALMQQLAQVSIKLMQFKIDLSDMSQAFSANALDSHKTELESLEKEIQFAMYCKTRDNKTPPTPISAWENASINMYECMEPRDTKKSELEGVIERSDKIYDDLEEFMDRVERTVASMPEKSANELVREFAKLSCNFSAYQAACYALAGEMLEGAELEDFEEQLLKLKDRVRDINKTKKKTN